jgi:hypothetical protein
MLRQFLECQQDGVAALNAAVQQRAALLAEVLACSSDKNMRGLTKPAEDVARISAVPMAMMVGGLCACCLHAAVY